MGQADAEGVNGIGLWPTLVLALALAVPFVVRIVTRIEPYPSAVLPEGGSVLNVHDGMTTYDATVVMGRNALGDLIEVDPDQFADPMWVHYLKYMARNGFGLTELDDIEVRVRGLGWTFRMPRHRASSEERAEVRMWLRERLREQGLDDQVVVVRQIERDADVDTGEVVATRTKSEVSIDL